MDWKFGNTLKKNLKVMEMDFLRLAVRIFRRERVMKTFKKLWE